MNILEQFLSKEIMCEAIGQTLIQRVTVTEPFDGAHLIVKHNQEAIVYVDGSYHGRYPSGRHIIHVGNPATIPNIVTSGLGAKKFPKVDIYFFNLHLLAAIPWTVNDLKVYTDDNLFTFDISGTFAANVMKTCNLPSLVNQTGTFTVTELKLLVDGLITQAVTSQVSKELNLHGGFEIINHKLDPISTNVEAALRRTFAKNGLSLNQFVIAMVNLKDTEATEGVVGTGTIIGRAERLVEKFGMSYDEALRIVLITLGHSIPPGIQESTSTTAFDYKNLFK